MSIISFAKKLRQRGDYPKKKPSAKVGDKAKQESSSVSRAGNIWALRTGLQPLVTEKSVTLQENNVATFRVASNATKRQIALAIRQEYKVVPRGIRTVRVMPRRRRRGRTVGTTSAWKKAYVKVDDIRSLNVGS